MSYDAIANLFKKGWSAEKIAERYGTTVKEVLIAKKIFDSEQRLKEQKDNIKIHRPLMAELIVKAVKEFTKESIGAKFTAKDISLLIPDSKESTVFDYLSPSNDKKYARYIRTQIPLHTIKEKGENGKHSRYVFVYGNEPKAEVATVVAAEESSLENVRTNANLGVLSKSGFKWSGDDVESLLVKLLNESYVIEEYQKDMVKLLKDQIELQQRTYELFEKLAKVTSGKSPDVTKVSE